MGVVTLTVKIFKPLELKAAYSISELVKHSNRTWSYYSMQRMLISNGVEFLRTGVNKRTIMVPLSELQTKVPSIWNSILEVDRIRNKLLEMDGVYVRR